MNAVISVSVPGSLGRGAAKPWVQFRRMRTDQRQACEDGAGAVLQREGSESSEHAACPGEGAGELSPAGLQPK